MKGMSLKMEKKKFKFKECNFEILKSMIFAVLIMEFFIGLNLVYANCSEKIFQIFSNVSYMEFLILGIIFFEISYKREDLKLALNGIEYVVVAISILVLQRIANLFNLNIQLLMITIALGFSIYYTLKSIIIDTNDRRKELESISDVKEIVKEEKPTKKLAKKRKV